MEDQHLFLSDTTCSKHLKCSDLVSDLRLYLSQEDRSRTLKRWENKAKVIYLDHIYEEMTTVMKYDRNPTLDECCQVFKIRKEKMEEILKDLRNMQSTDDIKSFLPSNLRFKKLVTDRDFVTNGKDNLMESKRQTRMHHLTLEMKFSTVSMKTLASNSTDS
jgi:YesN/AraC family two-component response regulator